MKKNNKKKYVLGAALLFSLIFAAAWLYRQHTALINPDQYRLSQAKDRSLPRIPQMPTQFVKKIDHGQKVVTPRSMRSTQNPSRKIAHQTVVKSADLKSARVQAVESEKPTLQKAPAKDRKWVKALSGERVQLDIKTDRFQTPDCSNTECPSHNGAYSLIGVIVQTDRRHRQGNAVIDGQLDIGDTQDKPLLYLK